VAVLRHPAAAVRCEVGVKKSHHSVMFRCNDDNGLSNGHVDEIDIADEIHIVCTRGRPPTFRVYPSAAPNRLSVGRRHCEHLGYSEWVGNVFWNAATMHVAEARRLIRDLLADGWTVESYAERGPFRHLVPKAAA
jgi:hypothetical protein